ncbi:KUP/HAK/KT family potassium transporter [Tundrisphaera sp. TA3]|uniref:KUP/HAK/KT family potassium transporter n=1 Tax=Tundrisphaera sp. TA3 TaxID=3435775 RepID=UPI003EB9CA18
MSGQHVEKFRWVLAYQAIAIVFGDIGTSVLYAMKETFYGHHPLERSHENVLGACSLFFWAITLVISIKYVGLVLRVNNHGEGGTFAFLGLLRKYPSHYPKGMAAGVGVLLLVGAALLYGEAGITPAISVLSAIEGLEVYTSGFKPYTVPIAVLILIGLFAASRFGPDRIGSALGLFMVAWFLSLIALAIPQLMHHPEVFWAVDPRHGIRLFWLHGPDTVWVLGAVVLCITGGEALFADRGHFGHRPIAVAWFGLVYPALILNYFGQGARLLDPSPIPEDNLFYALVPSWALLPMVLLATTATIIASIALIFGAFSLTQQAIALGVFPRLSIVHTNAAMQGQIYMPAVNWLLLAACLTLTISFRSSGNLAAAYGIAVTGCMAVTSIGFYMIARYLWGWPALIAAPISGLMLTIDLSFFGANVLKFFQGGYIPVIIAAVLFTVMRNWVWGRLQVRNAYSRYSTKQLSWLLDLRRKLEADGREVRTTHGKLRLNDIGAFVLTSSPVMSEGDSLPLVASAYISNEMVVPEDLTFLHIRSLNSPDSEESDRLAIKHPHPKILCAIIQYGFMEMPDLTDLVSQQTIRRQDRWRIIVGSESLSVDDDASIFTKAGVALFRFQLNLAQPAHKYLFPDTIDLDLHILKVGVPVVFGPGGAEVHLPKVLDALPAAPAPAPSRSPSPIPGIPGS